MSASAGVADAATEDIWNNIIAAKRKAFKAWKTGKGTRASYDAAKGTARHAVHHVRQKANKKV